MNKIVLYLALTLISTTVFSQKADTQKKKIKISIPKSDFFKNIKTYNIVIQGDDTWNRTAADKKKNTYENNLTKNVIEDYSKKDTLNADIRVFMGYKGSTYKKASNGQHVLDGDFKYLVLGKNNEIIYEKGLNAIVYSPTYNGKPYVSLANDLNNLGYKYLSDNNILTNEKEYKIDYGYFQKADEFSELTEFNSRTIDFLSKIEANSLDKNFLDDLNKFYNSYVGKEYQKMKAKDYNKSVYLNLALVEMFSLNFEKSLEYLENAKQGAGMLSIWPIDTKSNIESFITVNKNNFETKVENFTFDSAYSIYIEGSVTQNGKTESGKLKVDRFTNLSEGSIMETDDPTKPKVWIYKDNGNANFVFVDSKTTITTNNGTQLIYILFNNKFILVEKVSDNCYKAYESISKEIYCGQDGKFELKK